MLWELFWAFFKMGSLSIGGGYAILPLIQRDMVYGLHFLTQKEFIDLITISQMTPGPIVVNSSTFVGMRVAGVLGALVATIGSICMGVCISLWLYRFFQKHKENKIISYVLLGLRAVSTGLILASALQILETALENSTGSFLVVEGYNVLALFFFAAAMYLIRVKKCSPIVIILLSGFAGVLCYGW